MRIVDEERNTEARGRRLEAVMVRYRIGIYINLYIHGCIWGRREEERRDLEMEVFRGRGREWSIEEKKRRNVYIDIHICSYIQMRIYVCIY